MPDPGGGYADMSDMAVDYQRRTITVAEYHRMARVGILHPEERVELIAGEIVSMPPLGPLHCDATTWVAHLLTMRLGDRALVRAQCSVRLSEISEPQPDIAVVRWREQGYRQRHPGTKDIFLLVEVGDSSRSFDRRVKLPLYAASGVPEVWLVDVRDACIHVFHDPIEGEYRTSLSARKGERIYPLAFPDALLEVARIVG
jgi:Uma2 family endonuclease